MEVFYLDFYHHIISKVACFCRVYYISQMTRNYKISLLRNFIQLSLKSGSVQAQILFAACWRFAMVSISDNGLRWK